MTLLLKPFSWVNDQLPPTHAVLDALPSDSLTLVLGSFVFWLVLHPIAQCFFNWLLSTTIYATWTPKQKWAIDSCAVSGLQGAVGGFFALWLVLEDFEIISPTLDQFGRPYGESRWADPVFGEDVRFYYMGCVTLGYFLLNTLVELWMHLRDDGDLKTQDSALLFWHHVGSAAVLAVVVFVPFIQYYGIHISLWELSNPLLNL